VRILITLNNCLQGILELTPIIDHVTLFCILNIVLFELSPPPPPPKKKKYKKKKKKKIKKKKKKKKK